MADLPAARAFVRRARTSAQRRAIVQLTVQLTARVTARRGQTTCAGARHFTFDTLGVLADWLRVQPVLVRPVKARAFSAVC